MDAMELPSEALRLYFSEVKDSNHSTVEFDEEHDVLLDEVEQATDFLQKAGLSDLSKLYQQGKEISDSLVNDSVRQRHLTEKQAQTIRSRVRTLNKTLRNRQPRRKQRQDVRDVAWNLETSSTGSRSRSATPDSLDSIPAINEDLTSDEDQQQLSLPTFSIDGGDLHALSKNKLKWTTSEPIQTKVFSRHERGDVAHLGSENVVLKGYHPISETPVINNNNVVHRDRSGSDPSEEALKQFSNFSENISPFNSIVTTNELNSIPIENATKNNESLSFEGMVKQNEEKATLMSHQIHNQKVINVDNLTDSEYQYLKPLLWVEVTAIFDQFKIKVLKRKASNKCKRGNVFGVKLSTLVMRDMPIPTDTSMVPQVYQSILCHLNKRITEDGILRVAGQKQRLDILCNEIETNFYSNRFQVEEMLNEASVHDITGVLKKLLRELPDPVFTMELFDMFYKLSLIPVMDYRFRALNLLVLMLPIEHRNTCRLLINFFKNIAEHESANRMSLHNVAMITAPSFFPPRLLVSKSLRDDKNVLNRDQLTKEISDAAVCCGIMEILLRMSDTLWLIPAELATQAQEAQKRAQDRKDSGKDKKPRSKKKLQRSSTQYEPGTMISPRIKRDFFI